MRALSASAAALVRTSICSVTCSARPTSSCSKRPMRVSRVLATSMAREPSALSISSILAPIVSASLAPRVLMTPVTSLMRLSSAVTTSLPPSASVLAMSMTREDSASLSVWVRLSSASWKRARRWSSVAVTSVALVPTLPSKPSM